MTVDALLVSAMSDIFMNYSKFFGLMREFIEITFTSIMRAGPTPSHFLLSTTDSLPSSVSDYPTISVFGEAQDKSLVCHL